jgi:GT2 family glycosyltransferase
MQLAILRVHKDAQSHNRHWQSMERVDYSPAKTLLKVDIEGQIVHRARNDITELALTKPEWDWVWMVDDDMVFDTDVLLRAQATMDANPDIKVLTGVYFEKRFPHTPQLYDLAVEEDFKGKFWPVLDFRQRVGPGGIITVDSCGAGFLFIHREVIEKVKRPWFQFIDKLGEDFYFCRKARTAGYKIYCNVDMQATHLGLSEIGEALYNQVRSHLKRGTPISPSHGVVDATMSEGVLA